MWAYPVWEHSGGGVCNPHKEMIGIHLNSIAKQLDEFCGKCTKFIIIGDFNSMYENAIESIM